MYHATLMNGLSKFRVLLLLLSETSIPEVIIDHSHIVLIRPGWAHSQRRVGVNITIPLH